MNFKYLLVFVSLLNAAPSWAGSRISRYFATPQADESLEPSVRTRADAGYQELVSIPYNKVCPICQYEFRTGASAVHLHCGYTLHTRCIVDAYSAYEDQLCDVELRHWAGASPPQEPRCPFCLNHHLPAAALARAQAVNLVLGQSESEPYSHTADPSPAEEPKTVSGRKVPPELVVNELNQRLFRAIRENNLRYAKYFLNRGADINFIGPKNLTPLIFATMMAKTFDSSAMVTFLLTRFPAVNLRGGDEMTALLIAANYGLEGIVEQLIEAHADIDAVMSTGSSALMCAIERNHVGTVALLIRAGARRDFVDARGLDARQLAEISGNAEILRLLAAEEPQEN